MFLTILADIKIIGCKIGSHCDGLYGNEEWYIEMKKEENQH